MSLLRMILWMKFAAGNIDGERVGQVDFFRVHAKSVLRRIPGNDDGVSRRWIFGEMIHETLYLVTTKVVSPTMSVRRLHRSIIFEKIIPNLGELLEPC